jgi:glutaconate CoA-transferase subunit A
MGLPFFPTKSQLGTDIVNFEGFDKSVRLGSSRIAKGKMHIMDCPFTGDKVVLLPAINLDVSIIHVQKASNEGNVRIFGPTFGDIQQSLSAKKVIVTCEEVIEDKLLRLEPERNLIPFFRINHLVHLPYGAHPCACNDYYDYDSNQFTIYHKSAETEQGFEGYLNDFVYSLKNHDEYLTRIGKGKLAEISQIRNLVPNPD